MKTIRTAFILLFLFSFFAACRLSARPWEEITRSGKLIVLTADENRENSSGLHRIMMPIDREQILLKQFAKKHKLQLEYVSVPDFSSLFPMLDANMGDLISANLAKNADREKRYLLSAPFDYTNEIVFVSGSFSAKRTGVEGLAGTVVQLLPGTTYVENFRTLAGPVKSIVIRELPATIPHDELIEQVASGKIACSVLNECDLDSWLSYRSGIRKLFPVKENVPLVFAAGKKSTELIRNLNAFIAQTSSPDSADEMKEKQTPAEPEIQHKILRFRSKSDLNAIRKRGYLRLLTFNDVFCCYLQQGQLRGFEYETAKQFCDSLDVALVTVIPKDFQDLILYLKEGKGDLIAANFTMTPERIKAYPELTFCAPYLGVTQILVGRPGDTIRTAADLTGRKVYVQKSKSYYSTLLALQKQGISFSIVPVEEDERPLLLLKKVESGEYDLTVIDDTFYNLAKDMQYKITKLTALSQEQPYSWVVRKNNPQLAAAIQAFFQKENKGTLFNLRKKQYYSRKNAMVVMPMIKSGKTFSISPYDALFQKYGKIYRFPWYFLAAQSYQESRFKPDVVNSYGAAGLMQVMPETAKELGIFNLTVPENGIAAGARYLAKMRDRFKGKIDMENELCFALASYNAGYGHVQDARLLAGQMGLNPNVWFQHTEKALSLLETSKYAKRAKHGYCRASETIQYVQNIMLNTHSYKKMLDVGTDPVRK